MASITKCINFSMDMPHTPLSASGQDTCLTLRLLALLSLTPAPTSTPPSPGQLFLKLWILSQRKLTKVFPGTFDKSQPSLNIFDRISQTSL